MTDETAQASVATSMGERRRHLYTSDIAPFAFILFLLQKIPSAMYGLLYLVLVVCLLAIFRGIAVTESQLQDSASPEGVSWADAFGIVRLGLGIMAGMALLVFGNSPHGLTLHWQWVLPVITACLVYGWSRQPYTWKDVSYGVVISSCAYVMIAEKSLFAVVCAFFLLHTAHRHLSARDNRDDTSFASNVPHAAPALLLVAVMLYAVSKTSDWVWIAMAAACVAFYTLTARGLPKEEPEEKAEDDE